MRGHRYNGQHKIHAGRVVVARKGGGGRWEAVVNRHEVLGVTNRFFS